MEEEKEHKNCVFCQSGAEEINGGLIKEITAEEVMVLLSKIDEYSGNLEEYNLIRGRKWPFNKKFKPMCKLGAPFKQNLDVEHLDGKHKYLWEDYSMSYFYIYTNKGSNREYSRFQNFGISECLLRDLLNGCEALINVRKEISIPNRIEICSLEDISKVEDSWMIRGETEKKMEKVAPKYLGFFEKKICKYGIPVKS